MAFSPEARKAQALRRIELERERQKSGKGATEQGASALYYAERLMKNPTQANVERVLSMSMLTAAGRARIEEKTLRSFYGKGKKENITRAERDLFRSVMQSGIFDKIKELEYGASDSVRETMSEMMDAGRSPKEVKEILEQFVQNADARDFSFREYSDMAQRYVGKNGVTPQIFSEAIGILSRNIDAGVNIPFDDILQNVKDNY